MEKGLFRKIKSKYIVQLIFSYIQDENYIYKTFKYSKFYQKKLNLDYNNIKEKIIIFDKYLLDSDDERLNNDLKVYNYEHNNISFYIINYFRNHPNKKIEGLNIYEFSLDINILSPLFNILVKEDFFQNMFNIVINMKESRINNKIIENYRRLSKKKMNILSFKFIYGKESVKNYNIIQNNIQNFKNIFSNNDKIKKVGLSFYNVYNHDDYFYNNILLDNMENNLISLKIEKLGYEQSKDLTYLLNKITKFKTLTYLEICDYICQYDRLYKSELVQIFNDNKIKSCFSKLKVLKLKLLNKYRLDINLDSSSKLKLFNLEKLSIKTEYDFLDEIIDFEQLTNLKYYKGSEKNFYLLKSKSLEKVKIVDGKDLQKTLKILSNIQSLEEFKFKYMINLIKYDYEFIKKNENVKKIKLELISDYECILYDFQNKFPNLNNFSIFIKFYNANNSGGLKFIENAKCKVNKVNIEMWRNNNLELYINSYKTLESLKLCVDKNVIIKDIPLFSNNCNVIFESLYSLDLSFQNEKRDDSEDLNNLYKNIDKIPNLKEFKITTSFTQGNQFYKKFIEKILNLKLIKKINIKKNNNECNENLSRELLNKIFPNINLNRIYEINIENCLDIIEIEHSNSFFNSIYSSFSDIFKSK